MSRIGKSTLFIAPLLLSSLITFSTAHASDIQGKHYTGAVHSQLKIRESNDSLWSKPYGQKGADYLGGLDQFKDKDLTFTQLNVDDGGVKWLNFIENNTSYWVDADATQLTGSNVVRIFEGKDSVKFNYTATTNKYAIINPLLVEGDVYSMPDGEDGASKVGSLSDYSAKRLQIVKTAVNKVTKEQWVQVENGTNTKFWVKSSAVSIQNGNVHTAVPADEIKKSSVSVAEMTSDKSIYAPDTDAKIYVKVKNSANTQVKGHFKFTVSNPLGSSNKGYGYQEVLNTGDYQIDKNGNAVLGVLWHTHAEDYRGYLITLELYDDNNQLVSRRTTGIDVSSDWKRFPRYAALTNFSDDSQTATDNVPRNAEILNKFHINAAMYYDSYYRPQNPFPDGEFKTWLGDKINPNLIKNSLRLQHQYGQKGLLYNMINATTGSPKDKDALMSDSKMFTTKRKADGTTAVESKAGIFRTHDKVTTGTVAGTFDIKGEQQTNNMLGSFNDRDDISHKVQSYYNPNSSDWQNYIGSKIRTALDKFDFDGWQGDTIGDQEYVTTYMKKSKTSFGFKVSAGYGYFANAMKQLYMKDKDFGINSVGGQGQNSLDNSRADFQYSEIWPWDWDDNTASDNVNSDHSTYHSLVRMIDNTWQATRKSLIMPAYMYHEWFRHDEKTLPTKFNDNAILLRDASIFAGGGTSMELSDGGHQLYSEYYPDSRKQNRVSMTKELGDPDTGKLRDYYDFSTAYENILRDPALAKNHNKVEIWNGSKVGDGQNLSVGDSQVGKIMTLTRSGHSGLSDLETINLVNMVGVKNINWQVNNALDNNNKQIETQKNLHVKYYPDENRNIENVWVSSPDSNYKSANQNLDFETKTDSSGKKYIEFSVPSLQVWDLIYMN